MKPSKPDPTAPVVEALQQAGLVRAGETDAEEVRIPTSKPPVFGGIGGERRTFGGRQRWTLPGTNLRCTVGPRTVNVYTVHGRGDVNFLAMLTTKGIDLDALRAALRRGTNAPSGQTPTGGGGG